MKAIVFDLGGTLMQYAGMPHSWVDFYRQGFEAAANRCGCAVAEPLLEESVRILTGFNPRISHREIEYTAEHIFSEALKGWTLTAPLSECIEAFWSGLCLRADIFPDTVPALTSLKKSGYAIACMTDLPNAMPDEIFRRDIPTILECLDLYVSSATAGWRKPNCRGLEIASEYFGLPLSELVFVGDEEKDHQTALNARCRFIHIDRKGSSEGSIQTLDDLLWLL